MTQTNETPAITAPGSVTGNPEGAPSVAMTPEQREALRIAHKLVDAGIPVFVAARNHSVPLDTKMPFLLPKGWQQWKPNHKHVDTWRPGMALCALQGVASDIIDTDPRNGGSEGRASLADVMPPVFGVAGSPSGGTHELIARTMLAKGEIAPGVDLLAGQGNGEGRAFAFIAPTVRIPHSGPDAGTPTAYRWTTEPDTKALKESKFPTALIEYARKGRAVQAPSVPAPKVTSPEVTGDSLFDEPGTAPVSAEKADQMIADQLQRVKEARSEVNSKLGGAAKVLGRFVASGYLEYKDAGKRLMGALKEGKYHSDEWNKKNGYNWTAAGVIKAAFDAVKDDPRRVATEGDTAEPDFDNKGEITAAGAKKMAVETLLGKFLSFEQLLALPQQEPLIKGVLNMESATWLIGQPGGFKSFVALDWACHVATGRTWNEKHKVRKGKVVYLVAEGVRGFGRRVQAWVMAHDEKPDDLMILPMPIQARGEDGKSVSAEWVTFVRALKQIEPVMVVLDTQARLTVGMEENSNTEMGIWVKAVDLIKEKVKACVLVVHHTGRNGGDARGASAIDGAQDMEWRVDRDPHKLNFTLSCDKNKDGSDSQKWKFAMDVKTVGTDEDGDDITSLTIGKAISNEENTAAREVELTRAEGETLTAKQLVTRVLDELDPHRDGLTLAEVRRAVNGARKKVHQDPYKDESIRGALNKLRDMDDPSVEKDGQRYRLAWARDAGTPERTAGTPLGTPEDDLMGTP